MSTRKELTNEEVEKVAGGVDINNDFGDGSIYRCGEVNGKYTHTFSADRYNDINNQAAKINQIPGLTKKEKGQMLWDWMTQQEGLLTPIE